MACFSCVYRTTWCSAAPFGRGMDTVKDGSEQIIQKFFDSCVELAALNFQESPKVITCSSNFLHGWSLCLLIKERHPCDFVS